VILDEGHYIKSHTAQTSKAAYELGDGAKYRLLLTGTPMTNRQDDLFGEFRFVDKRVFGGNFYQFRNRYCLMGGFQNKVVVGEKNKDEMIRKLHSASLRVTKKDALDLPEETFETRYVELSKNEMDIYEQLRKTGLAELDGGEITAPLVITKMLRLQQVCGGFAQMDDSESPKPIGTSKLDALKEILMDVVVDGEQKIVVFARFLPEVHAICKLVEGMKLGYGVIYGAIPQEERGQIVEKFQKDPETKVFVAQIATAGLGITLHAASTAVFYSKDFSYSNVEQARARIHRIGQKYPCTYIDLVAEDTIDQQIQRALNDKKDLSQGICDNWREYFL
jgi:SNF2 family DNA or RNA helicase